jgi:hypothetical protein
MGCTRVVQAYKFSAEGQLVIAAKVQDRRLLLFLRNTSFCALFPRSVDSPSGDTILYFIAMLQKISNLLILVRGL